MKGKEARNITFLCFNVHSGGRQQLRTVFGGCEGETPGMILNPNSGEIFFDPWSVMSLCPGVLKRQISLMILQASPFMTANAPLHKAV